MSAQLSLTDAEMSALLGIAERAADSEDDEDLQRPFRTAAEKLRHGLGRPGRRTCLQ